MKQDLFELICSLGKPKESFLFDNHQTNASKIMMEELSISLVEAKLLIVIFLVQFTNKGMVNTGDLKEMFKLDATQYRQILQCTIALKEKKFITVDSFSSLSSSSIGFYQDISICEKLALAIIKGEKLSPNKKDFNDPLDILEQASIYLNNRKDGELTTGQCLDSIENIFKNSPVNSSLRNLYKNYSGFELSLFTYAAKNYFEREMFNDAEKFCDMLFDDFRDKAHHFMLIQNEELDIIKHRIVKLDSSMMLSDPNIALEHKAAKEIFDISNKELANGRLEFATTLKYSSLKQNLFFDKSLSSEVKSITTNLSSRNYKKVVEKLTKHGMSAGFNIMFYGSPGTGKTAMAYQIGYLTKRDIFQVDISKIKDKYVGESEKRIKGIFEEYKRESTSYKEKPILLFNEADSLIGTRVEVSDSIDQMHNSMQNILLEELEKFDGILIATTNLTVNLDDAFSRRFLYKLNFPRPNSSTRARIWKSKLSEISKETIKKLSSYDLSGGQIANIAKKYLLEGILNSKQSQESIHHMIQEELDFKNEDSKRNIGFCL